MWGKVMGFRDVSHGSASYWRSTGLLVWFAASVHIRQASERQEKSQLNDPVHVPAPDGLDDKPA